MGYIITPAPRLKSNPTAKLQDASLLLKRLSDPQVLEDVMWVVNNYSDVDGETFVSEWTYALSDEEMESLVCKHGLELPGDESPQNVLTTEAIKANKDYDSGNLTPLLKEVAKGILEDAVFSLVEVKGDGSLTWTSGDFDAQVVTVEGHSGLFLVTGGDSEYFGTLALVDGSRVFYEPF